MLPYIFYFCIRIILKFGAAFLSAFFDVEFYYKEKEQKLDKQKPVSNFIKWLFTPTTWFGIKGVGRYRILQKCWEIILVLFISFVLCILLHLSIWIFVIDLISLLIVFFLMFLERLYYAISDTEKELEELEKDKADVYWLMPKKFPYFIGTFIFKNGFTKKKFDTCETIAEIILIISSLIYV